MKIQPEQQPAPQSSDTHSASSNLTVTFSDQQWFSYCLVYTVAVSLTVILILQAIPIPSLNDFRENCRSLIVGSQL